ncbi:hypothetical protein CVT26_008383 [Gymnopilus dilepis]|uniref:Acyltransferase 3 domain-containing protein n=1 Tax=Gymnopilus dilepis TaxID=231916 RepID=A0A409XY94_9AGAR|nr:hypothetical protein CVT26_008383 [Gymnopilus dilepis]
MSAPEVPEKVALADVEEALPHKGDIEAQDEKVADDKVELPTLEAAEGATPVGSTEEPKKEQRKRIHSLDNLRAFLVFLLILQHAALETVAYVPDFSDAKYPRQALFLTLFVTLTRHTVVGLLFFVSGLASAYSMVVNRRKFIPLVFLFSKACQTTGFVIACRYAMRGLLRIYGPWPEDDGQARSFFATKDGNSWLLLGPVAYVLLLFAFDSIYTIGRTINLKFKVYNRFITSKTRYKVAQYTALVVLQLWITFVVTGIFRPPAFLLPYLSIYHAMPHFPVQYLMAYLAGVHYVSFHKYLLTETPPRYSPLVLSIRIFIYSALLFAMYRRWPVHLHDLSSLTTPPKYAVYASLAEPFKNPGIYYGAWSVTTFFVISPTVIQLFFTNKHLRKDWGIISRVTFLQPLIHMYFVMGLARNAHLFVPDNLILRSAFVGVTSAIVGWLVSIGPYLVLRRFRGVFTKLLAAALIPWLVMIGVIIGLVLLAVRKLGLPTPEWYNRRRNAAEQEAHVPTEEEVLLEESASVSPLAEGPVEEA